MVQEFLETTWEKFLNNIKQNVGDSLYKVWFSNLNLKSYHQHTLKIEVPSKFVKDWLEKKFYQLILKSIRELIPEVKNIEFVVSNKPTLQITTKKVSTKKITAFLKEKNLTIFEVNPQTNLNPRYRFDNFVVGKSNELAYSAALGVARSPGKIHNPLFIHGPVGVGKTHLLQAIGNEVLKLHKNLKVKYVTTEEFTNEFINALKNHNIEEFKFKFRDTDVLILDDVHFLSGKTASQEELFHTFNYLYNLSKQIVFSSDRPPRLISDIEERLRSRFEGGLVIDIQPPDLETRLAILKLKSQEKGLILDDKIYELIAQKITHNIRELEGALSVVFFYYQQENQKLSLEKIEEIIKKFSKDYYRKVTPKKIIKTLAEHYEIKEEDIFKKTRTKEIVQIRHYLIYFLRELGQFSYTSIGKLLKKDHTTIIYAYEKIVEKMKNSSEISQEIELLKSKILES